ncbi:hypothetical protein ACFORL_07405 [Legionella dresdenensis]|uniref:Ankyrin repeat protein n=1 Tax=Legionella dresdenensis TaxID=450200 RepID=A0ABV8CG12_9GAMM
MAQSILLSETNLQKYPAINQFLASNPPDRSLITDDLINEYELEIKGRGTCRLTLAAICVLCEKLDHIQIFSTKEKKTAIKAEQYKVILEAVRYGDIAAIKYLERYLTEKEKKAAVTNNKYHAIRLAVANGHIAVIEYLENYLTPEEKAAVTTWGYEAIQDAVKNGHTTTIEYLENHLASEDMNAVVKAWNYKAICNAAQNGHTGMLKYLESYLSEEEKNAAVRAGDYLAIRLAAQNGHTDTFKYLESYLSIEEKNKAIRADNYSAIRFAIENGHLDRVKYLEGYLSEKELIDVVKMSQYRVIQDAAGNGHTEVIKYFENYPEEIRAAVKAENYQAIQLAAKSGHLKTIEYLESYLTDDEKIEAVKASDYLAIRWAAQDGHLDIIKHFETRLSEGEKKEAVRAGNYDAIKNAVKSADIIRHLQKYLNAEENKKMVKAENYNAIQAAAKLGYTAAIECFEDQLNDQEKKVAVEVGNYRAIREAAARGQTAAVQHLAGHLSGIQKIGMVKADNYEVIQLAAANNQIDTINYFESLLTEEEKIDMVKSGDYQLVQNAIQYGCIAMIQHFSRHLTEEGRNEMLKARDYRLVNDAITSRRLDTIFYLLNINCVLAYMEFHDQEYGKKYVYPFVSQQLDQLQAQKAEFEEENPAGVFNITEDEAKQAFYLLRNLIRRGVRRDYAQEENLLDDIRFLLSIPAVKALCHQQVYGGDPNELLRLALSINNQPVAELLLAIPAVRQQAQRDGYYREEARNGLSAEILARDHESSMRALTSGEQKRLQSAIDRYQPLVRAQGADVIVEALRDKLRERYRANPAMIVIAGQPSALPESYAEFNRLALNETQRAEALKAYYQHKDHTALRYLSRPNYWIHPQAAYVNVEPGNLSERWSTFDEYLPVIAMLYLAATDSKIAPEDGHTEASRLEHFIAELALIGRAHNWDNKRQKRDKDGKLCVDKKNNPIFEEYDDLQPDRPSCFSGVKRRLAQSVIGHPLLRILTVDDIQREIVDFVRQWFISKLTPDNQLKLKKDYHEYTETLELPASYAEFNVPPEKQEEFKAYLQEKYGTQFTDDKFFNQQVVNAFQLGDGDSHIARFDTETQFRERLLEEPVEKLQNVSVTPVPTTTATQADLIQVIKNICDNKAYWQDKVRNPFKTVPDGVKAITALIAKKGSNPADCLRAIQNYCQQRHSKHFQMAHRLFRGRQDITNNFYGLLAQINDQNFEQKAQQLAGWIVPSQQNDQQITL